MPIDRLSLILNRRWNVLTRAMSCLSSAPELHTRRNAKLQYYSTTALQQSRDAPDTPILQDILQDISICSTIRYPAGHILLSGGILDSGYLYLLQQHRVRVLTTWVRCP